jgi:hypothetical protein
MVRRENASSSDQKRFKIDALTIATEKYERTGSPVREAFDRPQATGGTMNLLSGGRHLDDGSDR